MMNNKTTITGGTRVVTENFTFNVSAPIVSKTIGNPPHAFVICLFEESAEANPKNPHGISSIAGFFMSGDGQFYVTGVDFRGNPNENELFEVYEEIQMKIYEEVVTAAYPESF